MGWWGGVVANARESGGESDHTTELAVFKTRMACAKENSLLCVVRPRACVSVACHVHLTSTTSTRHDDTRTNVGRREKRRILASGNMHVMLQKGGTQEKVTRLYRQGMGKVNM